MKFPETGIPYGICDYLPSKTMFWHGPNEAFPDGVILIAADVTPTDMAFRLNTMNELDMAFLHSLRISGV